MQFGDIIDGYKIFNFVKLGGFEEIVAQGEKNGRDHYRLYTVNAKNPLGLPEYTTAYENNDFLQTMREFNRRISARLNSIETDQFERGNPLFDDAPLRDADCVPDGLEADITGKVIAVKSDILYPEYRTLSHQLHVATGGFGTSPTARGKTVFVTNVFSGETDNFRRENILGVVLPERIPEWAQEKLAALNVKCEAENAIPSANKPPPGAEKQSPQYESVLAKIDEDKKQKKNPQNRRSPSRKTSQRDF